MKVIELNANINTTTGWKAVTDALGTVQKGCRVRSLEPNEIKRILERVGHELHVPWAKLAGTQITYTGAQHFPNAYNGRPESTHFIAEHDGRAWHVIRISRDTCPDRLNNVETRLSDITKEALVARFRGLTV